MGRPRSVDFGELTEAIWNFGGQSPRTMWELAQVLEVSPSTAKRVWRDFKVFLAWSNHHAELDWEAWLQERSMGNPNAWHPRRGARSISDGVEFISYELPSETEP